MELLRAYLKGKTADEQERFAVSCGTTIGYMRKAMSTGQRFSAEVAIEIEKRTERAVPVEHTGPEIDWAYLRSRAAPNKNKKRAVA